MTHFACDIPEWEAESRLQYEADPMMDAALEAAATMTHEQRLALLDRLGIDYSSYLEPEPEPEAPAVPVVSKFDALFSR